MTRGDDIATEFEAPTEVTDQPVRLHLHPHLEPLDGGDGADTTASMAEVVETPDAVLTQPRDASRDPAAAADTEDVVSPRHRPPCGGRLVQSRRLDRWNLAARRKRAAQDRG
jgi:hypothetical protein